MRNDVADCACGRGVTEQFYRDGAFTIRCSNCRLMLSTTLMGGLTEQDVVEIWNGRVLDDHNTEWCRHCIGAEMGECKGCFNGGFHSWCEEGDRTGPHIHRARVTCYSGNWIDRLGRKCAEEENESYGAYMDYVRKRFMGNGHVRGIFKWEDPFEAKEMKFIELMDARDRGEDGAEEKLAQFLKDNPMFDWQLEVKEPEDVFIPPEKIEENSRIEYKDGEFKWIS